jgi:4'-phosphopantetheinyl transferase
MKESMLTINQPKPLPFVTMMNSWRCAPQYLTLPDTGVHVWRINLDIAPEHVWAYHNVLSADEQATAARFYFEKDRDHYIVARGVLRTILSRYLDIAPDQIQFSYGSHGKPALTNSLGMEIVNFNISHSHDLALVAISRGRQLGVDVEYIQKDFACEEIAQRVFSPHEVATLLNLPDDLKHEAFFNCWTRKEAYIKARGLGLSYPLAQFEVSLIPGEPARLVSVKSGDFFEASRWMLQELDLGPSYAGTLAVEGHDWQLECWQWSEL